MSVVTYPPDSTLARFTAAFRARGDDPRGYTTPRNKRLDMKFALNPHFNELISIIEQRGMMDVVRLKNTTGSTWTAPVLLKLATTKLTARTTATATNSPSGGASVVYLVSATFEVGQVVAVTSGGYTDYGIVTAISGGVSVTISNIWYDHTTPTITALPAYEASLADADDTDGALWVTTADIANGSYGWGFGAVESPDMDSSSYSDEALLYLSGGAGTFTATAPTGIDQQQQVVGVVKKSHASTGRIHWFPGARWFQKFGGNMLQNGINPEQQDWKNSVRVATTAAGTLATSFENGDTVDGITLATGDRILIKNQAAGAENGIYTVNASGAPTRATDADASAEVTSGLSVHVSEGTTNADTNWILTTNDPITLDSTALTFTQLSGSGGAPTNAQYVTLATNGTLSDERVLTAGSGVGLADGGAGSTITVALDVNGLSAIATALQDTDMLPIYDNSAAANKKIALQHVIGQRNRLINGDWVNNPNYSDSVITLADNTTLVPGWRGLHSGSSISAVRTAGPAATGVGYYYLEVLATNTAKEGIIQYIPAVNCIDLRGRQVTLSFWMKVDSSLGTMKCGIIEFTGTADAVSGDPISAWGSGGTTPTLAANHAFANTPANLSATGSWVQYSVTVTLGTSFKNLAVMIWNDDTTTTGGDKWYIADVQFEPGPIPTLFDRQQPRLVDLLASPKFFSVWTALDNQPPSSNYAVLDTRNSHPVLAFDAAADEAAVFAGMFPGPDKLGNRSTYDVVIVWMAASATSGDVVWEASFETDSAAPWGGVGQDLDSDSFNSAITATATCSSTSGILKTTVLSGLTIDLASAMSQFRLKVQRLGSNGSDTMAGDAQLLRAYMRVADPIWLAQS